MVPLATNGTIGKNPNGTIGRIPNAHIISWAPVDQATDESSGPNQLKWIALGWGLHGVWRQIHRRAIKECSIAINRDWVKN